LLSLRRTGDEIKAMRERSRRGELNPRYCKIERAQELMARFHGEAAADHALEDFRRRFQEGVAPEQMPEVEISCTEGAIALSRVLKEAGLTASTSEAMRLIKQGGVRIDGERAEDAGLTLTPGVEHVLQVGKRKFARVRIR